MLILFIFFPLFNSIYIWCLDLIVGKRSTILYVVHSHVFIMFLSLKVFFNICLFSSQSYLTLGTWINCGLFITNWGFMFDTLSVVMLIMVTFISSAIHLYSIDYMQNDPSLIRFISYLSLFTFFMFILVSSDNFIQLFLGWEGIGLCSYFLISFWSTRVQANKSALKALIINRIGDFGFLMGLCVLYFYFRSVDFAIVFSIAPFFFNATFSILKINFLCLDIISFFLFIGSMGKSAQIGLHTWLPDAMEAPTPVSALIHAATLVTAGIFLIIRCSSLFELSSVVLILITLLGWVTAFSAATIAIAQDDIKKIIAYSTCSQLGYMAFICGLSEYSLSLFHLINHAFFKALLFLGAGSIIHAMSGEQDIRKFGNLIKLIPFTYSMMLIGCLALCGFPFLSGFYSKDLILEIAFSKYSIKSIFSYWLGSISAMQTAFYSFRILYYTFWGNNISFKYYIQNIHELKKNMGLALFLLCTGSIFSGFIFKDAFIGVGTTFWNSAIYQTNYNYIGLDMEFLPIYIKNIPLIFSFFGIIIAICWNFCITVYFKNKLTNYLEFPQNIIKIYLFFNYKWYFDYIYNYYFGYTILKYSYEYLYKLIDKGFIEIINPNSFSLISYKIAKILKRQSLGYIYHLHCLFILNLVIFIFIIIIT